MLLLGKLLENKLAIIVFWASTHHGIPCTDRVLKGIQEYLQSKIYFTEPIAETMNKCLIFLKLNAWYTLNVMETVEHS